MPGLLILNIIPEYAKIIGRKEVRSMRCEYKDDFKVDYSGALHITKGDGVDLVVKGNQIPANIKSCLDSAVTRNSCHELRAASKALTNTIQGAFNVE
jgi:hypothetical protein